jgi:chromosome segregation ATPase
MATKKTSNGTLESVIRDLARDLAESQRRTEESQRRTDERIARAEERMAQVDERRAQTDERIARAEERMAQVDERRAQTDERVAQIDERHSDLRRHSDELFFEISKINAQIMKRLDRIETVLEEHTKVLERLPEAIRERVGFGRPA